MGILQSGAYIQIFGFMTDWGKGDGSQRLTSFILHRWNQKARSEPSGILETLFTFLDKTMKIFTCNSYSSSKEDLRQLKLKHTE